MSTDTWLREHWDPKAGDRIKVTATVFGEPLDSEIWGEMSAILILTREASTPGYWHVLTSIGESRVLTGLELLKETCEWLPWPHQIVDLVIAEFKVSMPHVLKQIATVAVVNRERNFDEICQLYLEMILSTCKRSSAVEG